MNKHQKFAAFPANFQGQALNSESENRGLYTMKVASRIASESGYQKYRWMKSTRKFLLSGASNGMKYYAVIPLSSN